MSTTASSSSCSLVFSRLPPWRSVAGKKVEILADADELSGTVVLSGEDHTIGNSLRFALANRREVEFVGYSVPHPSENKINIRIQNKSTENNAMTVTDSLISGLDFLSSVADILLAKLSAAELSAIASGVREKTSKDPSESAVAQLIVGARAEQEKIRKQHENANMEEQD